MFTSVCWNGPLTAAGAGGRFCVVVIVVVISGLEAGGFALHRFHVHAGWKAFGVNSSAKGPVLVTAGSVRCSDSEFAPPRSATVAKDLELHPATALSSMDGR